MGTVVTRLRDAFDGDTQVDETNEKKKEGKGMSGAPLVAGVPSAFFSLKLRSLLKPSR